jgi:mRNA interferase HigB
MGGCILFSVRVIALRTLREFWQRPGCEDAEEPLKSWFREVGRVDWRTPADIRQRYATASFLSDNRVCFNIGGNKYRLIVRVIYRHHAVYVRFIGTHAEYDRIDANEV